MDNEMEQFQNDLLASVRQMKAGKAARLIDVNISPIISARNAAGLSQAKFAELMGISVRTLQDWEQGRRGTHTARLLGHCSAVLPGE